MIQDAINVAVEKGGYEPLHIPGDEDVVVASLRDDLIALDPAFWKALGKAKGWYGTNWYDGKPRWEHEGPLYLKKLLIDGQEKADEYLDSLL